MAQEVMEIESAWEDAHFPRQEDTGVVLGLSWGQVLVAGSGIAVATLMIVIGGFTWVLPALAVGIPITVVGVWEIHKRSLISWFGAWANYVFRGLFGRLACMRTTPKVELSVSPH